MCTRRTLRGSPGSPVVVVVVVGQCRIPSRPSLTLQLLPVVPVVRVITAWWGLLRPSRPSHRSLVGCCCSCSLVRFSTLGANWLCSNHDAMLQDTGLRLGLRPCSRRRRRRSFGGVRARNTRLPNWTVSRSLHAMAASPGSPGTFLIGIRWPWHG